MVLIETAVGTYLARVMTLASGDERYAEGGNLGMGSRDLGDRTCSSQWHPHVLATSTGSHLTSREQPERHSREPTHHMIRIVTLTRCS